jgi:hypothetical protein
MSHDHSLIRETIELLKEVRVNVKMHGDVEDNVIQQLDEAIWKLEELCRTRQDQKANQAALKLVGEFIKWLPIVAKFIELLRNHK